MDGSSRGKCEPVIVFECMDLSISQRVNVSGLSCVSNKVLRCWDSYKVIYEAPQGGGSLLPSSLKIML